MTIIARGCLPVRKPPRRRDRKNLRPRNLERPNPMLKPANARPEYVDANGDCTLLRETEKAIKRAATNPGARTNPFF